MSAGSWTYQYGDGRCHGVLVATLIARNEAAWIGRCLDSLDGVVDGIVVCDTGSEDETVAVASSRGCVVVHHDWDDDFSAARNVALDAAVSIGATWVLSVDADEQLVDVDVRALRSIIEAPNVDLFGVRLWNFQGPVASASRKPASALVPRLFNALTMHWVGRLHEHPRPRKQGSRRPSAEECTAFAIEHWGYCDEFLAHKRDRNLQIAQRAFDESHSPIARFELARSLSFAKQHDVAQEHFLALREQTEAWAELTPLRVRGTLGWLGVNALSDNRPLDALGFAREAASVDGPSGPPRLLAAQALAASGDHAAAFRELDGVTDVADGYMLYDTDGLEALRCVLAARCGDTPTAVRSFALLAEKYPVSKHTQAAFQEIASLHPVPCGVEIVRMLPRDAWLPRMVSMPAVLALPLATAAIEVDGPHRMPLLAWSRVATPHLSLDVAFSWTRRLVDAGAPSATPLHTIAADPARVLSDREEARAMLASLGI